MTPNNRHDMNHEQNPYPAVRFGDMVHHINERVEPAETDLEIYVGLEHLDPESLKIRRYGIPSDVTGTKLRFYPGDIIFGKRRYYQKKLAVAEWDGICSAHAMVLRAKPDVILPEFLPFFMQSEMFFERAMAISVGSLSPTINWGTLKKQEFPLPPLDEQHRIAEILWAVEDAIEAWLIVNDDAERLKQSVMEQEFSESKDWPIILLKKIAYVQTGIAKGKKYTDQDEIAELPYLRVANVQDGYLDLKEIKTIAVEKERIRRYMLQLGDVLMTEGGDYDKLGRGTVWRGEIEPCLHQNHVFCVRPNPERILPEFLSYQASSPYGKRYFLKCSKQTTNLASVNSSQVKAFPVLLPPINEQERIVKTVEAIDLRASTVRNHLYTLRKMKSNLINTLMSSSKDLWHVQRA